MTVSETGRVPRTSSLRSFIFTVVLVILRRYEGHCVCGRRSKCALFVNISYIGQTCLYKQRGRPNCWARSNARARLINSFVYKSMRRTWRHRKLAELLEGVRMEYILCCNGRLVLTIHLYQHPISDCGVAHGPPTFFTGRSRISSAFDLRWIYFPSHIHKKTYKTN